MALAIAPDIAAAVRDYLLSYSEIVALVGQRVAFSLNKGWNMPQQALVLVKLGGPLGMEDGGLRRQRLLAWCYGASLVEANALWRTVDAALDFTQRQGMVLLDHALITDIQREGEETAGLERDTQFPRSSAPYLITYSQVAR